MLLWIIVYCVKLRVKCLKSLLIRIRTIKVCDQQDGVFDN